MRRTAKSYPGAQAEQGHFQRGVTRKKMKAPLVNNARVHGRYEFCPFFVYTV